MDPEDYRKGFKIKEKCRFIEAPEEEISTCRSTQADV